MKDFLSHHPFNVIGPHGEDGGYFSSFMLAATRVSFLKREPLPGLPRGNYYVENTHTGMVYEHMECMREWNQNLSMFRGSR